MFRRIVVPLDGSARAEKSLAVAGRLARATGSRVLLLRVVNVPVTPASGINPPQILLQQVSTRLESARLYLRNAARSPHLERVQVETEAIEGPIAETILEVSDTIGADLIVICSHGHTGALHWPLGSVAHDVVKNGDIPTFVLREHGILPGDAEAQHAPRALIALDGSPYAERIVIPAINLVEALAGHEPAEAHLYAVIGSLPTDDFTHYLARLADELRLGVLAGRNVTVRWSLGLGDDYVAALANAASGGDGHGPATFVALATHARSGWQRWVNGSVTESLLKATRAPLLLAGPAASTSTPLHHFAGAGAGVG